MLAKENWMCDKMLSMENIGDWLLKELEKRKWSQSDLVKAAGISRGTLSNIISGTRGVGEKTLVAIADALDISPITIFRKARWLPEGGDTVQFEDWQYLLEQLSPEDQEEMRELALLKIKRRKEQRLKTLKPKTQNG